ncbi:MAG: ATPase [Magnetovibrio sp.]|nr:ATPase [Magnetovibrio sp.]|tara:strand:+ start:653 stop:1519 length:867 start_codon:yes stop_codon:yes gene_type:complete
MALFSRGRGKKVPASGRRAHVIVIGNEKGGSGKSTTAMHLIVALLQEGRAVASIDVDARQGTLSRYIANRKKFIKSSKRAIDVPDFFSVDPSKEAASASDREAELERLRLLIEGAWINHDVLVVDTPGSASELSRLAHSYADTLITPINDSLVDFDVLAHVDPKRLDIKGPSHYAEMVWEQKKVRADRDGGNIDWIVMRNRLSNLDAHNKREMERLVRELGKRVNFRAIPGFGERVIFRELFLIGLTILDLKDATGPRVLSHSHHAARQEVFTIVNAIGLPPVVKTQS